MSAENTGSNLGDSGTVTTIVNVVGARNTTVTSSCEHGKTATRVPTTNAEHSKTVMLVPASTNATPVVPLLSGNSQNSLPILLQLLCQATLLQSQPPLMQ